MKRALARFEDEDDPTINEYIDECRATVKQLAGKLHDVMVALARESSAPDPEELEAQLTKLRSDLASDDSAVRLLARVALTQKLREFVTVIGFDGADLGIVELLNGRAFVGITQGECVFVQRTNNRLETMPEESARLPHWSHEDVLRQVNRLAGVVANKALAAARFQSGASPSE